MSRSLSLAALVLVLAVGGLVGPGSTPARAQGALGAAGMGSPRVLRPTYVPSASIVYRRYTSYNPATRQYYYYDVPYRRTYVYDARARQYVAYDVPVTTTTTTYTYTTPTVYPGRVRRPGPGIFNGPRRAAGIGAQGADGRTNPDEWVP